MICMEWQRKENNMVTEKVNNAITISIRYCFSDDSVHSMNAEIFNECERQFIQAIKGTQKYLEHTLSIDIKAREEGSLTDIITIIFDNLDILDNLDINPLFTTIQTLLTIFAVKFFDSKFSSAIPKTDETSKKIENVQKIREGIKNGTITEPDLDYITNNDRELRKHKSNFFKTAKKEPKISKLEMKTTSNLAVQPIIIVVEKKEFDKFIIPETTETIENTLQAKIYIVAPILVKGRKDSWKGIYENDNIDFNICDDDFLEQVWNQSIEFRNGTFINCDLKIIKTTNIETGELKISRKVIKIINYGDDDKQIVKITHKKKPKKEDSNQPSLFDNVSSE